MEVRMGLYGEDFNQAYFCNQLVEPNLRRKGLASKLYEKAFEEGKSWPPKEEYEAYKALNHMRNLAAEPEQTKEARKIAQEESHTKKKPAAAPAPAQHH
jgi:GNAT superfamily N-acetyltransferase